MATKKQKISNVPNLRFPGFEGEWTKMNLEKASEKINSGKTPLGGESTYTTEGVVFIRSQNVNRDKLELNNTVFISDEVNNSMKNSVVRANDILLNITGASLGRSCVVPPDFETGNVNQHVCIIRLKDGYNPRFIQPVLSSSKGQSIFLSLQTGSGREGLNFESIKSIELDFPRKGEQDKIARFLALIDQRIETQNKIIEQLETLMQGLRVKVFTQKMRFRDDDGGEFAEWEGKTLGDVAEITMGQSPESNSYNTEGVGMPLIQGNADITNRKSNPRNYTSDPTKICEIGDIILTVRAPVGATAKSYHKACIGRGVCSIKNNSKSTIEFLYQYLLDYEPKWVRLEQGSTFTAISGSDIRSIEIAIPSVEEQTKIANLLSAIDEKIEAEKKILVQYEVLKRYLLQNLFI